MMMKYKSHTAYSLLELTLVLTVIVIACLIIVPPIPKLISGMELKAEARKMATQIRRAQQMAKTTQIKYGIYFNPTNNYYQFCHDRMSGGYNPLETYTLDNNIDLTCETWSPQNFVYFDHLGSALVTSDVQVTLDDGKGNSIAVKITAMTGKVTIEKVP